MHEPAGAPLAGIYAIVDPEQSPRVMEFAEALLGGGIRLLQLRDKRGPSREAVEQLHRRCRDAGARLIINDDLELAEFADGVHLGQTDLQRWTFPLILSRLRGRILGISASTPAQARAAQDGGADYLGTGPFRPTQSKAVEREAIGCDGLRAVVDAARLPVAAIGGITVEDLAAVAASGARMAAVISALSRAPDPREAARALVARWEMLHP